MDKIDDFIFNAKLQDIKLNKNQKIISCTIGIIFFNNQLVYAQPSMDKSNEIIEFLKTYGPPMFLTLGELLKLKMPLKLHMKNL